MAIKNLRQEKEKSNGGKIPKMAGGKYGWGNWGQQGMKSVNV
jgi:hypothetical protein